MKKEDGEKRHFRYNGNIYFLSSTGEAWKQVLHGTTWVNHIISMQEYNSAKNKVMG